MTVYFRLYASDGTTLVHTFSTVFSANYPHSEKSIIEHTSIRGKGSLIIDGGEKSWTLTLKGVLFAADYEALTVLIDAMESAIVIGTSYVLKINKTPVTVYSYNCKRISPIIFDETSLRTDFIEYTCELLVNSW